MIKNCIVCNKEFNTFPSHSRQRKTCSRECCNKYRRKIIGNLKQCGRCKKMLPHDEFHKDKNAPAELFRFCKVCAYERVKEWRKNNAEKYKKRTRDYMRKYRIGALGKDFRKVVGKRDYPSDEKCELCKEKRRIVYHHWNNSNFAMGMWICTPCHVAAHWLEKHDPQIFYKLKNQLSQ